MSVFSKYSASDDVDVNTDVFDVYSVITQYVLVSVLTEYEYSEYSCVFKRILTMNSGEFCIRSDQSVVFRYELVIFHMYSRGDGRRVNTS